MASEPGGRADKLGNEFEKLWAVRHLIDLVAGTAVSVRIECLGDDEKGTEFWVVRPDGTREAHQCKRENASGGRWSVARLEAKRVISRAKFQLDRDPTYRFVFVSSDKAPHLADLCERATTCESALDFRHQSVTTSRDLLREFRVFCSYLKLDPDQPPDVERALDFLRRFRPIAEDKLALRGTVEALAAAWFTGDPAVAVGALKDLIDTKIGRTIAPSDVITALPDGIRPRNLSHEATLHSQLDALRERFDRSYRHLLIGGAILGRRETEQAWKAIITESESRVVILHGPGGEGKSGVVFELVERLRESGVPYLPLRLDRDRPADSPLEFGRHLQLPGSPAACLAAASDGERGVLILDQIDAIRWTSAHSSHAWDTCERLIAEALRHPSLRVVVVCRSFDVEDDPRIRAWKGESKASEVKVGPLEDETVDRVISACGVKPSTLVPGQRRVLQSPQGLYLWSRLHQSNNPPVGFRTLVDLMREFWRRTRRTLRELKPGDYDGLLETLVEYLDKRGTLAAPETAVSRWVTEVEALVSMNVLLRDRDKIVFTHQSYLDHLTAEHVIRDVHAGSGTVLGWLEGSDQSLFRRGQLRQLLALLRDDDPRGYEDALRTLLRSVNVRFHLKHLALQMLGHADPPMAGEIDLAIDLIRDETWRDHVVELVFSGRTAWADALHARGILRDWFHAEDESLVNRAVYLMNRVIESRGEMLETLLLDQRTRPAREKLERLLWMAAPERLSPRLFRAFVRMTRTGSPALWHSIRWKALAAANPLRCIDVLHASLCGEVRKTYGAMADESIGRGESRGLRREDVDQVAAAATRIPIEAWDKLVPLFVRIRRRIAESRRTRDAIGFTSSRYIAERELARITLVLTRVLTAAGRVMSATDPAAFWQRVNRLTQVRSAVVSRLLARCMVSGRDDEADASLQWLFEAPGRLRCGGSRRAPYRPAFRLLRRYSRLCSAPIFSEVLSAVLAHRPQAERDAFLRRHELFLESLTATTRRENGDVLTHNVVGLGRYVLLSALARDRLTVEATSRLDVLRRKFGPVAPHLKQSRRRMGGWVRSTIPKEHLSRLSDRHWLSIIAGRWRDRPRRWRQMAPDELGEATATAFAADLGSMTKLEPRRFARLALAIPESADPGYARAILHNLADTRPPGDLKNPEKWQAATVEETEAVADHFGALKDDREFATALCWTIIARGDELWSEKILAWLTRTAMTHPHPREGEYSVYTGLSSERSEPDLLGTAINCVRGVASDAIQSILFSRRETRQVFRPAIEALTNDPHPAVRVAAIGLALPIFNIEREAAVTTCLTGCAHERDDVLRSRYVNEFLRYTILTYAEQLAPLIERMVQSRVDEVAKAGGGWVGVVWAHRGIWEDRLETCLKGPARLRAGLAHALALAVADECRNAGAAARLSALFDDPDRDVRAAAANFFRCDGAFDAAVAPSLVQRFAASAGLDQNMNDLLSGLEDHTGELKHYGDAIFTMADRLSGPLAAEARDHRTSRPMDATVLAKVLLRLYEQTEHDRKLRRRCLDAWDRLISQRVGIDTLPHIDA